MHGKICAPSLLLLPGTTRERARAFGKQLIDKALSLRDQPERGRKVPGQEDPAVREIIHGAYRIIYEVVRDPDAVFVLRFWHGARGTPEIPEL